MGVITTFLVFEAKVTKFSPLEATFGQHLDKHCTCTNSAPNLVVQAECLGREGRGMGALPSSKDVLTSAATYCLSTKVKLWPAGLLLFLFMALLMVVVSRQVVLLH